MLARQRRVRRGLVVDDIAQSPPVYLLATGRADVEMSALRQSRRRYANTVGALAQKRRERGHGGLNRRS